MQQEAALHAVQPGLGAEGEPAEPGVPHTGLNGREEIQQPCGKYTDPSRARPEATGRDRGHHGNPELL